MSLFPYDVDIPLIYVTRTFAGLVCLLACVFCGTSVFHFWSKWDAFSERARPATGVILSVSSRGCSFFDHCLDNQASVHTAIVSFRDGLGAVHETEADFRWAGREAGDRVSLHYLADDPSTIVADDLRFARGQWVWFMVQFAIAAVLCAFFAIGLFLPKGTLIGE